MDNDLKIINNDEKSITVVWKKKDSISFYSIVGMNKVFNYETIKNTKNNIITIEKNKLQNYLFIKVNYIYYDKRSNKEILLDSSNELDIHELNKKNDLIVKCIKSYNGYTLSILNKKIYDKYCLYKKEKDKYSLALESEDFIICSKKIKENEKYYIEAYSLVNNNYIFEAKSKEFICIGEKISNKSNNLKISIIVPTYNCELFISRCLDSLLLSTIDDKEIIVINDGSNDNSRKIVEWYEKEYKNIVRLINHDDNYGLSIARNTGIKSAQGKFIGFVDSDDFVHSKMYENLYEVAAKEKLSICIGTTLEKTNFNKKIYILNQNYMTKNKNDSYKVYSYDEMFQHKTISSFDNIYFTSMCNKIVKSEIIKEHLIPDMRCYEDSVYTKTLYSYFDKFGFAFDSYYVWDHRVRNVIDTISVKANKSNNLGYYNSLFSMVLTYPIEHGNKEKMKQIVYDGIKDIYSYLKDINFGEFYQNTYNFYINIIKETDSKASFLTNEYIIKDKELFEYLKTILNS